MMKGGLVSWLLYERWRLCQNRRVGKILQKETKGVLLVCRSTSHRLASNHAHVGGIKLPGWPRRTQFCQRGAGRGGAGQAA
jgi:hypothetical protein